jgi:DNA polymerase I
LRVVAFDTETYLIVPGRLLPRPVCLSWVADEAPHLATPAEGLQLVRAWLASDDVILVGHNVAYDLGVLCAADPTLLVPVFAALDAGRIRDTMLREQLLAIAEGRYEFDPLTRKPAAYNLAALVARYFGADISADKTNPDAWRLRYAELDGVPLHEWPPAARAYALDDAAWTLRVYQAQGAHARNVNGYTLVDVHGNVTNEGPQVAAAFALILLSAWGVVTDPTAVAAWENELAAEVATGEAAARSAGFLRDNGTIDQKALRARIQAAHLAAGRTTWETTTKGAVATGGDALEASGDPILAIYAASLFAKKQVSTYLEPAKAGTRAPINAGYTTLRETGRTSCFRPNLQNPPRGGGYRACFVPRPGFLFCSVDYDTVELRALAQIQLWWFGRSALADAIIAGRDPHLDLAAVLLGTDYPDVLARKKEPAVKTMRQTCKPANFALWGGMGLDAFIAYAKGQDVILDPYADVGGLPSGEKLINAWREKWQAGEYLNHIAGMTRHGNTTVQHVRSGRIRGDVRYTQAANGYFQGLAADWAKAAMWTVARAAYTDPASPLWGSRPVLFLHDEIIAEVPEATAHDAATEMARVMMAAAQPFAPDVPITASPALMRRWYKGADPTYHNGRLVPWEPK